MGGVSIINTTMSKRTRTLHGIQLGHVWCIEVESGIKIPGRVVQVSETSAKIELPAGEFNITPRSDVEYKPSKSVLFFK